MTARSSALSEKAVALRAAFDRSFAERARLQTSTHADFLTIRLGTHPFALRLADVASLVTDREITRLPGPRAELIGIAGFRGAIVPVYDLGALLSYPASPAPRWLVVASAAQVALAFEAFDGHMRVAADAVTPGDGKGPAGTYVREVLQWGGVACHIIELAQVIEAIRGRMP